MRSSSSGGKKQKTFNSSHFVSVTAALCCCCCLLLQVVIHGKPLTSLLSFYLGCIHTHTDRRVAHGCCCCWRIIKKKGYKHFSSSPVAAESLYLVVVDSDCLMRFYTPGPFGLMREMKTQREGKKKCLFFFISHSVRIIATASEENLFPLCRITLFSYCLYFSSCFFL